MELVKIGTQNWCTKNLNVSTYSNGDTIPMVQDADAWRNLTTGAWCYYENKEKNGSIYGKLYNWFAVNDPRGLAPKGFHIPGEFEWRTLTDFLGGDYFAGTKMKSTSSLWKDNGRGTNESGFAGLPGGYRFEDGTFCFIGEEGKWWEPMEYGDNAMSSYLTCNFGHAGGDNDPKQRGLSVRCLLD
ncbi:MAG: fibrobacter succinogenes major paralogous domain-containing protein [Candidatus Paceibacterota bacterium]